MKQNELQERNERDLVCVPVSKEKCDTTILDFNSSVVERCVYFSLYSKCVYFSLVIQSLSLKNVSS